DRGPFPGGWSPRHGERRGISARATAIPGSHGTADRHRGGGRRPGWFLPAGDVRCNARRHRRLRGRADVAGGRVPWRDAGAPPARHDVDETLASGRDAAGRHFLLSRSDEGDVWRRNGLNPLTSISFHGRRVLTLE